MPPPSSEEPLHRAAAEGFAVDAERYARGRPEYPPAVDAWLRDELGLRADRQVLELGAGTGKFTSKLSNTGAAVIAVEPVDAMRAQFAVYCSNVSLLDGTAEAIPAADASVDAVVCAQSFHWFANEASLREIHRVLKPGGVLGLLWNVRDESVPWVAELTEILEFYSGDAPRYWTQGWRRVFETKVARGFSPFQERRFPHVHVGPVRQVIVDRTLSVSFIAALPHRDQEQVTAQVHALIARTSELASNGEVSFPYETAIFWCDKLP